MSEEISLTWIHDADDEFVPHWRRYDVKTMLGEGSHSTVWLVQDTLADGRHVAIKQFHLGAPVPQLEFALLSSLKHRSIPRAYDLFFENERWNMVMDAVRGDDLRGYRSCHGGIIPAADVREIGVQLASALDELHRQEILYRDLKPTNVLREPSGRVVLVDMG